jgi:hypothetical protein
LLGLETAGFIFLCVHRNTAKASGPIRHNFEFSVLEFL